MIDFDMFFEPIREDLSRVESIIQQTGDTREQPIQDILLYSFSGGKRIRPAMVILIARMLGIPENHCDALAAAVEILHTATLIHDDLVDEAPLRRKNPSHHTQWSPATSILTGDVLLARAVFLITSYDTPDMLSVLSRALISISSAEIQKRHRSSEQLRTQDEYYMNIEAKTASLFRASAEMTALLTTETAYSAAELGTYGHEMGIAFQIVDDVLDFTGDARILGKKVLGDLQRSTITLPMILYLEETSDGALDRIFSRDKDEQSVAELIQAMHAKGVFDRCIGIAKKHVTVCKDILGRFPDNPYRQLLYGLTDAIVKRSS
jgi:geranylgeranyl pyrophosphate synthase